jgi:hypothetical protein
MIIRAIETALSTASKRSWDKTYWCFDIHGTIIKPTFKGGPIPTDFYPYAKECLQRISQFENVVMILQTCSYPHEIEAYIEFFKPLDIHFKYIGENPEVANGPYGYYDNKFYFNVMFEDKAGFDPENDWKLVFDYMELNFKGKNKFV